MPHPLTISRRRFLLGCGAAVLAARVRAAHALDVSGVDKRLHAQALAASPSMQFRGTTAEECRAWQVEFAAKLRTLLGPHAPPQEWKTDLERSVELSDHRREEIVLSAEGVPPLPMHLLLPHGKPEPPRPAVLALHGHGHYGHDAVAGVDDQPAVAAEISKFNYDYGRQLVRRGYVVAAPCLTPFGRRLSARLAPNDDDCSSTFIRLQFLGKLLIAENVRDCLWALEFLARHPRVDRERLGCVGLSYGGRMATLTTALDSRVRVAALSGALNLMQERIRAPFNCGAQVIPGLLQFGDIPEIGSLIAPRPCVWERGSRDFLLPPRWTEEGLRRLRLAYKALGAEDQLLVDEFDGWHRWNGALAYPLLDKTLQPKS